MTPDQTLFAMLIGSLLAASAWRFISPMILCALGLTVLIAASLSPWVWNDDPAELRTFIELHLFGVAALLQAPPTRLLVYAACAPPPFVLTGLYFTSNL